MADKENGSVPPDSGTETNTRKTVKLKLPSVSTPGADPMAGRDTDTGNLEMLEDTQTRKTVKLKPLSAVPEARPISMEQLKPAAVDPLKGRDSDTGNLEILADTQTRKTVKLKPLVPPAATGPSITPPAASAAPAPAVPPPPAAPPDTTTTSNAVHSTNTRKVLVLKPSGTPASAIKLPEPVPATAPAEPIPAAPAEPEQNTDTVKVPKSEAPEPIKPSIAAVKLPPVAPPAPMTADATTQADSEDATVKIARPAIKTPPPAAPAPVKLGLKKEAAPAQEAPPAEAPASAPAPAPVKLGLKKEGAAAKETPATSSTEVPPASGEAPDNAEEFMDSEADDSIDPASMPIPAPSMPKSASSPSMLYTVLAVITLLILLAGATITTVHYLNIHGGQEIQLPGLPTRTK